MIPSLKESVSFHLETILILKSFTQMPHLVNEVHNFNQFLC